QFLFPVTLRTYQEQMQPRRHENTKNYLFLIQTAGSCNVHRPSQQFLCANHERNHAIHLIRLLHAFVVAFCSDVSVWRGEGEWLMRIAQLNAWLCAFCDLGGCFYFSVSCS